MDSDQIDVKNNAADERFEVTVDGSTAFVQYYMDGKAIVYVHTQVPSELEGKGIGSALARTALEYAKAQGYQVVPQCPFIAAYIQRHKEYQPLILGS